MNVAGVILAAGASSRFPAKNKLLLALSDRPLVYVTSSTFRRARLDPLLVVVGHESELIGRALDGLSARIVPNPYYARGQSMSITMGIQALPHDVDAVILGLADMPLVSTDTLRRLLEGFERNRPLLIATRDSERFSAPVLFARPLFHELLQLSGDRGAREVVERHIKEASFVDVDPVELLDVDDAAGFRRVGNLAAALQVVPEPDDEGPGARLG